ncbi:hypothetical protein IJT17_03685 [bacterium]|nr:hypothetical protein [bacterium]
MWVLAVSGLIIGFGLGQRALEKRLINGVTGSVALLVILCFAFTTILGWCHLLLHSRLASLLFSSWFVVLFSAWLGLFGASVRQAWLELRTPVSAMKFSSLSDKYVIIRDNPHKVDKSEASADVVSAAEASEGVSVSKIAMPFGG